MKGGSDVIFLKDAIERAQKEGISGKTLTELEKNLSDIAQKLEDHPIDREKAYLLIDIAKVAQILEHDQENVELDVQEEQLSPMILEDFLNTHSPMHKDFLTFMEQQSDLDKSISKLSYYTVHLVKARKDPVTVVMKKAKLEQDTIDGLRKASTSRWFYTEDLLWRYLFIRGFLPQIEVSSIHGPIFTKLDDGKSLSALNLKTPLLYLVSCNQIENTCGFSAVANTCAVDQQLKKGTPITFKQTRALAQDIFTNSIEPLHAFKALQDGDGVEYGDAEVIIKTATDLGLASKTLEILDRDTIEFLHKAHKEGKTIERNTDLSAKFMEQPVTHIIYNVGGGHWILLSVVTKNNAATLILLNTSNAPLKEDDDVARLLHYIDDLNHTDNK